MLAASRVENVLIILSPLSQKFLEANTAVDVARTLREKGATRADLAVDPRLPLQPSRHMSTYPVPDFTQAARSLSKTIFEPIIGQSDVQDFSRAIGIDYRSTNPDLETLSNVGDLFAHGKHEGKYVGFALYMAVHGKSSDQRRYTHLLYPDLPAKARWTLTDKFDGRCDTKTSEPYGANVHLGSIRERISTLVSMADLKHGYAA